MKLNCVFKKKLHLFITISNFLPHFCFIVLPLTKSNQDFKKEKECQLICVQLDTKTGNVGIQRHKGEKESDQGNMVEERK